MMSSFQNLKILLPIVFCVFMTTFAIQHVYGQESFSSLVDLKDATSLKSEIQINAGVLRLSTHANQKAEMRFLYTRQNWKPEIDLNQGMLTVKQPQEKNNNMDDDDRNEWDIKLPRTLSGDLIVRIGAGESTLDLQEANLERLKLEAGAGDFSVNLANARVEELEINAGVGEVNLDLSGRKSSDLRATINGGIGDLNLVLPTDTGVRIKINGLGSVDKSGFTKQNGYYVNEAYGHSPYTLEITVNGGLGSVDLAVK